MKLRGINKGDWLLSTYPDKGMTELSIFALVLDTRKTFTKVARWQAFGRFKLSDAVLPTVFIRKYYKRIGKLTVDAEEIDKIRLMLSNIPEESLNNRNAQLFNYNKALFNSNTNMKALEAIIIDRQENEIKEKFEIEILRCLESRNPETEECKNFLDALKRDIEKIYSENSYIIYRDINDKVEDVVKN